MASRMTPGKLKLMTETFSEIELRKIDLNLLLVFSALMREGSVSRAATRLSLGASAVSMALARLRAVMSDPLFVRAGAGMEPTARARRLWERVEPALGAIEAAVRGARAFDPATAQMTIRFAAPDDLEFVLVPRLIERLQRVAPGIRLVVRPSDFRTLLARLDSGDADLALSATPTSGIERRHRVAPLHNEGFVVLFDRARTRHDGPLDLETYTRLPHVLLSIAGDLRGLIDDTLARRGRTRTVLATVAHFPTIPFILRAVPALANMPAIAAGYFAREYGLALSPLPFRSPRFEVSMVWHVRTDADPAHVWFRDLVSRTVAELRAKMR